MNAGRDDELAVLVCGLSTCNRPLSAGSGEVLCDRHLALMRRTPPPALEKWGEGGLSEEELAEVSRRVERDAWPFFLVALSWCANRARRMDDEEAG